MDIEEARHELVIRIDEANTLEKLVSKASIDAPGFAQSWELACLTLLTRLLGDNHEYSADFNKSVSDYWTQASKVKDVARKRLILLQTLDQLDSEFIGVQLLTGHTLDPQLWRHVKHLVESGQWAQVASQSAIYLEDKLRQWSRLSEKEVSTGLMTLAFRPNGGVLPLGSTEGEREGWHQLARGFAAAIRNVDTHRIQKRTNLKRYAVGVLGTASLILSQVKFEHAALIREVPAEGGRRPPAGRP